MDILKKHRIQDRARILDEAKKLPLLDAALRVLEFNHRYNVPALVPAIDLHLEVLPSVPREECEAALRRAGALHGRATELGAAFYGYPGAPPYDVVAAEVRRSHPGFSEASYESVAYDGKVGMR